MVHRRLVLIVPALVLLATPACRPRAPEPAQNSAAPSAADSAQKPDTAIPLPQPSLDREQLIFGALRALSAAALGQNDADRQKPLSGRDFELHLRFGCPGAPDNPSRAWTYDEKKQVLRVHVGADLAADKVPASDLLLKGYEGAIGFVVEKPLLLTAGCPSPQLGPVAPLEPTIAVAQIFTNQDSRVQRPQRTYQITKKIDASGKPAQGLDLVIAGRLTPLSDDRPIHCAFAQGAPACIIAAKFDRVSIENPVDGSVVGEWSQW
jgi:hypothetical protein